MTLPPIRPRQSRLQIDVVRDEVARNPMVLKVTSRDFKNFQVTPFRVSNVDIEFSQNFFYWNDTNAATPQPYALLMVPFQFNGEE